MLTREQMIEKSKRVVEKVSVTAWGEDVFMRGMTGAERNGLLLTVKDEKKSKGDKFVINQAVYTHELLTRCLCDENGKRLFFDEESAIVGGFPAEVLDELLPVAQRLSGLDEEKNS
jgi:hypothetical protein